MSTPCPYCGTLDFGCPPSSMCDGTFYPVCNPQVCNVPHMVYSQYLSVGIGTFSSSNCQNTFGSTSFEVYIYRELFTYKGQLTIYDANHNVLISSQRLECYHSNNVFQSIAIFHLSSESNPLTTAEPSRELTIYLQSTTNNNPSKFFAYSAPLSNPEISLGGTLVTGQVMIYADLSPEHH